jgi:hypothetical protein
VQIVNKKEQEMLTDDQTELVRLLKNPHRISNNLAMFKACEKAAALIEEMDRDLDKAKAARKSRPAKAD